MLGYGLSIVYSSTVDLTFDGKYANTSLLWCRPTGIGIARKWSKVNGKW